MEYPRDQMQFDKRFSSENNCVKYMKKEKRQLGLK